MINLPPRILLCTDLDRTLLPNGHQPESPAARIYFRRLAARPEITLAYVSGRDKTLVEQAIVEFQLPEPDWVIGDVGTTLYRVTAQGWRHSGQWEQAIAQDWRGVKAAELAPLFDDLPGLRLQEASKQNGYKLSYYLSPPERVPELKEIMLKRLAAKNINANVIYSVDETSLTGLVDVLPANATKLHAVEFLMRQENFTYTNTLFAGDSGNDLPVLVSPVQSVLVANAVKEVIEEALLHTREASELSALYVAKGGFMGMNGNYCAGILEGVAHYFPQSIAWMS